VLGVSLVEVANLNDAQETEGVLVGENAVGVGTEEREKRRCGESVGGKTEGDPVKGVAAIGDVEGGGRRQLLG